MLFAKKWIGGEITMKQKKEDYPMRVKLLRIALDLYLEYGFTNTTNQMIVKRAQCSPGELTHFFGTKENILYEILKIVLPTHQKTLEGYNHENIPPVIAYALEIAVELAMCEQSDVVKDLYINAYTLPSTMDFIRYNSYKKSISVFKDKLISWTEREFYETEILSMGIVYMAIMDKCEPRYNIKQKVSKVIDALLKIYEYDSNSRKEVIATIISMDLEALAKIAEDKMRKAIEESFN